MTAYSPALDGLRGIAILLVLLHHYTILDPVTPGEELLAQVALIGWCGVDLFFVLSGFLITGILIDARHSQRYFTSFYARRTLRIFPLYYLVAFLALVLLPYFPSLYGVLAGSGAPTEQWPYWLYLTNFAIASRDDFLHGVLDITWSLAIEEQFYIVWAVVVWVCRPSALGWLCALIVLAAPVARTAALAGGATEIDVYVLPWFRADALAAGALLAWLVRRPDSAALLRRAAPYVAFSGLAAVIAICVIDGDMWWWEPTMQRAGYSAIALSASGMVLAAVTRPAEARWPQLLSAGWLRAFGKYSYCLYLIHLPIMRLVRTWVLPPAEFVMLGTPWIGQLVFYVLATAPAFALAWLSWRAFEAPILRFKSLFPYHPPSAPTVWHDRPRISS